MLMPVLGGGFIAELEESAREQDGSVVEKERRWCDFRHGVSDHFLGGAVTEFDYFPPDEIANVMELESDMP